MLYPHALGFKSSSAAIPHFMGCSIACIYVYCIHIRVIHNWLAGIRPQAKSAKSQWIPVTLIVPSWDSRHCLPCLLLKSNVLVGQIPRSWLDFGELPQWISDTLAQWQWISVHSQVVSRLDLWHQRAVELTLRKSMVKQVLQRSQRQDDFGWVSRAEKIMGTTNDHQWVRIQCFFWWIQMQKGETQLWIGFFKTG